MTSARFSVSASEAGAGTSPWVICLSHCDKKKNRSQDMDLTTDLLLLPSVSLTGHSQDCLPVHLTSVQC